MTILGVTGDKTPIPEERKLRGDIEAAYQKLSHKFDRGEIEALSLALRYSLERRGECAHGRERKRFRGVLGSVCDCQPAEYVAVPRWLLTGARVLAEDAVARASDGRGQHGKLTTRFRSELKDVETFRLVESMRRKGKSLEEACESGGRGVSDSTIRAAHRRVARNPERYRRALEWAASLPRFRERESHFPARRAEAIDRVYGDSFLWLMERAMPWTPFYKPTLPRPRTTKPKKG